MNKCLFGYTLHKGGTLFIIYMILNLLLLIGALLKSVFITKLNWALIVFFFFIDFLFKVLSTQGGLEYFNFLIMTQFA